MNFTYKEVSQMNEESDKIMNTYMTPWGLAKYFFTRHPRLSDVFGVISFFINLNTIYWMVDGSKIPPEIDWIRVPVAILVVILNILLLKIVVKSIKYDLLDEIEKSLDPKVSKLIGMLVFSRIRNKDNTLVISYDLLKKYMDK